MVIVVQARPCPVASLCFVCAIAHHNIHINMRAFSFHFFILNQPTHWTDHSHSHLFLPFCPTLALVATLSVPHSVLCALSLSSHCVQPPLFSSLIFTYFLSIVHLQRSLFISPPLFSSFSFTHTHSHTPTLSSTAESPILSFSVLHQT